MSDMDHDYSLCIVAWQFAMNIVIDQVTDHLMAHILTLYALGATPEQIRAAFERNKVKQHMGFEVDENAVQAISDKTKWKDFVGRQEHYPNFLAYFQREVESKGLGETLQEHLFAEDDHANDLLARMFSGKFWLNMDKIIP